MRQQLSLGAEGELLADPGRGGLLSKNNVAVTQARGSEGAVNEDPSKTSRPVTRRRKAQPGRQGQQLAEGTKAALRHEIRPRPCWWTALLSSLQVGQAFMEQIPCKGHRYCPFSREAIQPGLNVGPGFSDTLLNANYKG